MKTVVLALFSTVASLAITLVSDASVTDVRLYHLGEADPGALPLGPGNPTTVDSASGINAIKVGLTFYNGTGGAGPPVGVGLAPGSTMSMRFQNVDSRYQVPVVGGLLDNFGVEAYIQPETISDARPFYNGGDGTPLDALNRRLRLNDFRRAVRRHARRRRYDPHRRPGRAGQGG